MMTSSVLWLLLTVLHGTLTTADCESSTLDQRILNQTEQDYVRGRVQRNEREGIEAETKTSNNNNGITADRNQGQIRFPMQTRIMVNKGIKANRAQRRKKLNKKRKSKGKKQGNRKRNRNNSHNNRAPNKEYQGSTSSNSVEGEHLSNEAAGRYPEYDYNSFEDYKDYTNYGTEQDKSESDGSKSQSGDVNPGGIEYPDYGFLYNDRLPGPNTGLRLEDIIAGEAFFPHGTSALHDQCELPGKPGSFQQNTGQCNYISRCVNWWKRNNTFIKSNCIDNQHNLQVCCIENANVRDPDKKDYPAFGGVKIKSSMHAEVKVRDLEEAIDKGRDKLSGMIDSKQLSEGLAVKTGVGTPEAMYATFTKPGQGVMELGTGALKATYALSELAKSKRLRRTEAAFGLSSFNLFNTTLGSPCSPEQNIKCDVNYPYRSFDGSCNNLLNPHLGKANTAYGRLLPPNYADGIYAPPSTVRGGVLPSPHIISNSVITEKQIKNDDFNGLHSTWWQFISYDLAKTPTFRLNNGSGIQCCKNGKLLSPEMRHPMCYPIQMSGQHQYGRNCMNFVRSVPASRPECNLGYTEQMNEATHFLDLSNVYGTSKTEADSLRTFNRGMLRSTTGKQCGCELLPGSQGGCYDRGSGKHCFKTGDSRSNASPLLIVLHTLFVRRHNLLAKRLHELNPFWDDERLYQETRRLVIAEYQKITYDDWLDYLGVVSPWRFKPYVRHMEKPVKYNFQLNPALPTELPTAVLRAGQAMIRDTIESHSLKPRHTVLYSTPVEDAMYNVTYLRKDHELRHLLIAMNERREDHLRGKYNKGLHSRLFKTVDYPGFDLLAINIQRGRDHGLRPWNDYRELCGFKRYKDWDSLRIPATWKVNSKIKSVYKSIDDVDLLTGLLIEKQEETFTCLLLNVVRRLREADRFYFEYTGHPGSFTKEQITEIHKSTSARFLCSVSGLEKVNKVPFYYPSNRFPKKSCDSYGDIDLEPWRDVAVQTWHGRK